MDIARRALLAPLTDDDERALAKSLETLDVPPHVRALLAAAPAMARALDVLATQLQDVGEFAPPLREPAETPR